MRSGKAFSCTIIVSLSLILTLVWSGPAVASITAIGDIDPAYDGTDPWILPGNLAIGVVGDANVVVSNGARVTAYDTRIAVGGDSSAILTVTGAGSLWESQHYLYVGSSGAGTIVITDGGRVTDSYGIVGYEGTASARVSGAGSNWTNDYLEVGLHGHGDLTIADGAQASAEQVLVGLWGGGSVTVTGADSHLEYSRLVVGDVNEGTMVISAGAHLVGEISEIGAMNTSTGTFTVTGPNSLLDNSQEMVVGGGGNGTLLIADGGRVANAGYAYIAAGLGGVGSAIVTGPNSVWTNAGNLYVGGWQAGAGGVTGTLSIRDGGFVEANDVTVWSPGVLEGDGTLRTGTAAVRGTVRLGLSLGTLTVDGNVTFDATSVLEAEVDNRGNSDRLAVTGDVNIVGGTVRPVGTQTITRSYEYTIIEGNSVTGTFDVLDTALLDAYVLLETVGLNYEPNLVLLSVTPTPFDDPNIVRTRNERALGGALEQIAEQGGNDVTTALQQLQTADEVRQAYDQLSGQTIPSLAPVSVADTTKYMSVISHRLRYSAGGFAAGVGLPSSPAGPGPAAMAGGDRLGVDAGGYDFAVGNGTPYLSDMAWALWGSGYGLFGDRESESGVPGYDYQIYGGAFGLDYQFAERLVLGVTLGYSEGNIDYTSSPDEANIAGTHVGLYGRYATPRWYLDAIGTYTGLSYETHRFVDLLGEQLEGKPSGYVTSGYIEAGLYRWWSPRCLIQPLAAFQFAQVSIDSFTESGGAAALHFDSESFDSYRGSLGVKVTQELCRHDDSCRASVELRGRWVHEFGDTQASLDADFASNPGVVFQVSDAAVSRDSAVLGAGLDTWFSRSFRAFADYTAELNSDGTLQAVSAGLEYRW